jgi:4-diphosphocytidyl-2-C-methyl-D-erythritol kinase
MSAFLLRAFAKINLSLRIKGRREDGFHEVQTILQAIDLHDRLTFEPFRGAFEIRCQKPGVPVDCTNLIWTAAQQLWKAAGRDGEPRNVRVTLDKKIPMQAGLGGGSSDAAAALRGLRRVWTLQMPEEDLVPLAASLGSDVPYFLVGGTALGLGRGEEVYPLVDLPRTWVVLVMPPFGVATGDAYAWWDEGRAGRESFSPRSPENGARPLFASLPCPLGNDFEPPVIARHPVIAEAKRRLEEQGALMAAMSGSGSTVFGLFGSGVGARRAAKALQGSDFQTRCVRFRPRPTRGACP